MYVVDCVLTHCEEVIRNSEREFIFCFFFQAEDGIRDLTVTGVQTCALPIYANRVGIVPPPRESLTIEEIFFARSTHPWISIASRKNPRKPCGARKHWPLAVKIGRASCRERV